METTRERSGGEQRRNFHQPVQQQYGNEQHHDGSGNGPDSPIIRSFSPDSGVVGDGITNASTLVLNGTAAANDTLQIFDGSTLLGTATASSSGAWSYTTAALANGSHSFTATDTVNGTTSPAMSITVDSVAPASPVISSSSNSVSASNVTLTGTAEANSTVTVFDGTTQIGTATANASGAWTYTTAALPNGNHAFTATATDAAGNTSGASTALNVTVNAPPNLVTNGSFETGNFSGWTLGGNFGVSAFGPQTSIDGNAEIGQFAANIGAMGSDATLSQAIQTTAGQHYTLTFWLANRAAVRTILRSSGMARRSCRWPMRRRRVTRSTRLTLWAPPARRNCHQRPARSVALEFGRHLGVPVRAPRTR